MQADLQTILVYAALAVVAPSLAVRLRRLRLPVVAVEIVLGMIFGADGLGLLHSSAIVGFLSEFGLCFLMFLSGVEIDFARVRRALQPSPRRAGAAGPALLGLFLLIVAGVSVALGGVLERNGLVPDGIVLALLMASSAPTVVLPVLKESDLTRTAFGQMLLTLAVLADVLGLLAVSFAALVLTGASPARTAAVLILIVPFAGILLTADRIRTWWARQVSGAVAAQAGVRVAIGIITAFMALSAAVGTATVFGAFLAGLLVGVLAGEGREPLQAQLDGIGWGYFIPFFFLNLGSTVDLRALGGAPKDLLLVPAMLAAFLVITIPPALLLRRFTSWRLALGGGFLLAARLSVTAAGVQILGEAGLLSPELGAAVIVASILSSMAFPAVFHRLTADAAPGGATPLVVTAGDSPFAAAARRLLAEQGYRVAPLVAGSPPPGTPSAVLALDEDVGASVTACRHLRADYGDDLACIVRVAGPGDAATVTAAGMTPFMPDSAPLNLLLALVRYPALAAMLLGAGEGGVRSIVVASLPRREVRLRELPLPPDVLVLTVGQGRQRVVARGSTRVRIGDLLTVMGPPADLDGVEELLGRGSR